MLNSVRVSERDTEYRGINIDEVCEWGEDLLRVLVRWLGARYDAVWCVCVSHNTRNYSAYKIHHHHLHHTHNQRKTNTNRAQPGTKPNERVCVFLCSPKLG